MDAKELFLELEKVWYKMDDAKKLVDEGKEVLCSNRLQGAITNIRVILENLRQEIKNSE